MTVAENLVLHAQITAGGLLAKRTLKREAEAIITRLGFPLSPGTKVDRLTRAERQMAQIANGIGVAVFGVFSSS